MSCYHDDEVRIVPAVRFVISRDTGQPPRIVQYYAGPLSGWCGAWQVAWHFPRRADAEAMVGVLGYGTILGVYYDGSDCWIGLA